MTDHAPTARVTAWLRDFEAALARRDVPATLALFGAECFWRDMVSFTWNIRTFEGHAAIGSMLEAVLPRAAVVSAVMICVKPGPQVVEATPNTRCAAQLPSPPPPI